MDSVANQHSSCTWLQVTAKTFLDFSPLPPLFLLPYPLLILTTLLLVRTTQHFPTSVLYLVQSPPGSTAAMWRPAKVKSTRVRYRTTAERSRRFSMTSKICRMTSRRPRALRRSNLTVMRVKRVIMEVMVGVLWVVLRKLVEGSRLRQSGQIHLLSPTHLSLRCQ